LFQKITHDDSKKQKVVEYFFQALFQLRFTYPWKLL